MNARELRRHFTDADLAALMHDADAGFRALLDRLGREGTLPKFSKDVRDRIAVRSARLLAPTETFPAPLHAAAADAAWYRRGRAHAEWLAHAGCLRAAGSLAFHRQERKALPPVDLTDGHAVAQALCVAIREITIPGISEAQSRLGGEAQVAFARERHGVAIWERALRPLLPEFARNARNHGLEREAAARASLVAAAALTGRAADRVALSHMLGAAASVLLKQGSIPAVSRQTSAALRLAADAVSGNALRLSMYELTSGEARLLGAASACAAFGKGNLRFRESSAAPAWFSSELLPEAWKERYGHLTAAAVAAELHRHSADPRIDETERALAIGAAQLAGHRAGARRISFADALGFDPGPLRTAVFAPGRLFDAAPKGRWSAPRICRGKHGRSVRCRAVADASGALVGYLAFDPLSREFGGRPLFAAYGLDGRRAGYAWADETPAYGRAGAPLQGFVTVPEALPPVQV